MIVGVNDDFEGREIIKLHPNTRDYPVGMSFSTCSSETANDGAIPFGDALSSAEVRAYDPTGADVTEAMVTTPATAHENSVRCAISHFSGMASGLYRLMAILTMESGYRDEYELRRVKVEAV